MAKGKKTGGRKAGTPNKATVEKIESLERQIIAARESGKKLPREMLYDAAVYFGGMMAHFQPSQGTNVNPHNKTGENDRKFWRAAKMHIYCARLAAEFYSPRLKALGVAFDPSFGQPAPDAPRPTGDNVIDLQDANALAQNYKKLMRRSA